MDQNYQQFELQALIDLLAEETQRYTKAFSSGKQDDILQSRATADALIVEINRRKKEGLQPAQSGSANSTQ